MNMLGTLYLFVCVRQSAAGYWTVLPLECILNIYALMSCLYSNGPWCIETDIRHVTFGWMTWTKLNRWTLLEKLGWARLKIRFVIQFNNEWQKTDRKFLNKNPASHSILCQIRPNRLIVEISSLFIPNISTISLIETFMSIITNIISRSFHKSTNDWKMPNRC